MPINKNIKEAQIIKSYEIAKEIYGDINVDVDKAIKILGTIPISLHCWQGDDVTGFENSGIQLDGGLQVTGNYPGKATNIEELQKDLELAYSLIPGKHRLNLHAIYADNLGQKIERDQIIPRNFQSWIDWAKKQNLQGIDFNPTLFSHPLAKAGWTLSHADQYIRDFWVAHCIACRKIGEAFGRAFNNTCITNIWIPDGCKDLPIDRLSPRMLLRDSLDKILQASIDKRYNLDAVESKLFGIGTESYVVGSHEFYLGYAIKNNILLCLDAGHFHPSESIADKLSAILNFIPELLLHVTRGVRWDSDHIVILNDDTKAIMQEVVRGDFIDKTHIGLDFFDATVNRLAAWVIGAHATLKALLLALLEPVADLLLLEIKGNYTKRLAHLEYLSSLPFGAIWNYYCLQNNVPTGMQYLDIINDYENRILSQRNS